MVPGELRIRRESWIEDVRPDPCFWVPTRGIKARTAFGHWTDRPSRTTLTRTLGASRTQQKQGAMALTRSISRLDLAPMPQTVGDSIGIDRGALLALSQRKLNALGTPVAYVDRNQRYRFVNKALLDWFG